MLERIRKIVTYIQRTHREQRDREFNYRGYSIAVPMEHQVEWANFIVFIYRTLKVTNNTPYFVNTKTKTDNIFHP